jgi:GAF domain-containing protein
VCAHTGWPVAHLWLVSDRDAAALHPGGAWHLPSRYKLFKDVTETAATAVECNLPRRVLRLREPAWIDDLTSDPTFRRRDAAIGTGLCSACALPVFVGDDVAGVVEFFTNHRTQRDGYVLEVLATVALDLGRVLERTRAAEALQNCEERLSACLGTPGDVKVTAHDAGMVVSY